jgi:hypothetical protein
MAILVGYSRARAESIGVDLKGKGIAERAERILILAILAFIPFRDNISVALWIISILSIITILERLKIVSEIFGTPIFSVQTLSQIFRREDMTDRNYSLRSNNSVPSTSSNTSTSSTPASTNYKTSNNAKLVEEKQESKKESKPEVKPSSSPKANFIDKTDPNETGRNVAQLIFEQENEDKKAGRNNKATSASTTNPKKQDNPNGNSSSTSNSTTKTTNANSTTEEANNANKDLK